MSSRPNSNRPSIAPPEPLAAGRFNERDGRVGGGRRVAAALCHAGTLVGTPLLGGVIAVCVHNAAVAVSSDPRDHSEFLRAHAVRAFTDLVLLVAVVVLAPIVLLLTRSLSWALLILLGGIVFYVARVGVATHRACQGRLPDGRRLTTPMPSTSTRRARRIARRAPARGADAVSARPV